MKIEITLLGLLISISNVFSAEASHTIKFTKDTIISSPLTIPENTTLQIKAGVTVFVDGYHPITILGLLVAEGTIERPITITGKDRARGSIEKPCWQGLQIRGANSDAVIRNVRIEGAYRNLIWSSRPAIDSCTFTGNHAAIFCSGGAAPRISSCKIYGNVYGIAAESSSPMLLDNTVTGNKVGLHLQLGAKPAVGRNIITANDEDIRTEEFLGDTRGSGSVKYLWDLMNQLY